MGPTLSLAAEVTVIKSQDLSIYQEALDGFKKVYRGKLREFNLEGDREEAKKVVAFLKKVPPKIVLAVGLLAARVAQQEFPEIPVIFCMVLNSERFFLSAKNMTGVSLDIPPSLVFEKIEELFPERKKLGLLFDPKKTGRMISQAKRLAQKLGLSLISQEVNSEKDLPEAMRKLPPQVELLWLVPDSTVITPQSIDFLFLKSFEANLPIFTFSDALVKKGAVASLSPVHSEIGKQAGKLVLKIINGERPDQLPIRHVHEFRLSINLKTAKKMGIYFSPKIIQPADKIYE